MAPLVQTLDIRGTSKAYYAPATILHSQGLIHVSGQAGTNSQGYAPPDYESQIQLALLNLHKIIIAASTSISSILKLTLYIVDYDPEQRKHTPLLKAFLGSHRPAITLVPVPQLAVKECLFEIDAVIATDTSQTATPIPKHLSSSNPKHVDVVIMGAGLAGLAAAYQITKAGLSCVVLEARDRVGGRTWSHKLPDGGVIDVGAAWINDTNQSRAYALARAFGAELIEQNTSGDCVLQDKNGSLKQFPYGQLPPFDQSTRDHLASIRDVVEADCQQVDCASPQDSSLDSLSFAAYLKSRNASDVAIATAAIWTRAMLGQEPEAISAIYFLNYCKSGGGLLQMRSDQKHGGQYLRIRQGTQLISTGLADALPKDTVKLSDPVISVQQLASQQNLVQTRDHAYLAHKVISAIPETVLKTLSFTPELPPAKRLLIESFRYGYYTKVMMVFKTPFWVQKGFCGLTQSFTGLAIVIRDTSSPSDSGTKHVLTCFLAGKPGQIWASKAQQERKEELIEQIGILFECPETAKEEFVQAVESEWANEPYSGYGCPCPSLPVGILDTVGHTLRELVGDIHFAGTETAEEWKGYMEGAIRSGEREATLVTKALSSISSKL